MLVSICKIKLLVYKLYFNVIFKIKCKLNVIDIFHSSCVQKKFKSSIDKFYVSITYMCIDAVNLNVKSNYANANTNISETIFSIHRNINNERETKIILNNLPRALPSQK